MPRGWVNYDDNHSLKHRRVCKFSSEQDIQTDGKKSRFYFSGLMLFCVFDPSSHDLIKDSRSSSCFSRTSSAPSFLMIQSNFTPSSKPHSDSASSIPGHDHIITTIPTTLLWCVFLKHFYLWWISSPSPIWSAQKPPPEHRYSYQKTLHGTIARLTSFCNRWLSERWIVCDICQP